MKRYQECPWYIKLWRCRHYLLVPYRAIRIWYYETIRPLEDEDDWRMTFGQCWSLAIGIAQSEMYYVYTWEEVNKFFEGEDNGTVP